MDVGRVWRTQLLKTIKFSFFSSKTQPLFFATHLPQNFKTYQPCTETEDATTVESVRVDFAFRDVVCVSLCVCAVAERESGQKERRGDA